MAGNTRRIALFFLLNLTFMVVQLTYGIWTNSLGLISDSVHMGIDCAAIAFGLAASIVAQWPASKWMPGGYSKVEAFSGLCNGVFLLLVALGIFVEAVQRLMGMKASLHTVHAHRVLPVSAFGLLVNLVGVFALGGHHHHHHHHHDEAHGHAHDANMEGLYLHVLADLMGSCGVVFSSLVMMYYDWPSCDALASLFVATLIVVSVLPLIRTTLLDLVTSSASLIHLHPRPSPAISYAQHKDNGTTTTTTTRHRARIIKYNNVN